MRKNEKTTTTRTRKITKKPPSQHSKPALQVQT
jgi:hypothetical protein